MTYPASAAASARDATDAREAYERHILSTEGPYHVDGRYFASPADADCQRRWAAERMLREVQRRETYAPTAGLATRARVGTWLTPRERTRADVAITSQLALVHRESVHALRADLGAGAIDGVLVSAALLCPRDTAALAALLREYPGTPVVGVVIDADEAQALRAAILLGHAGAETIVDARAPLGWSILRCTFDARHVPERFIRNALAKLLGTTEQYDHMSGAPTTWTPGWRRFLTVAFSPYVNTTRMMADTLAINAQTFQSRFLRAGLPSPKRYLAFARLTWAAHLLETPGLSVAAVALRLDASSPQSFGRTVRLTMGMCAGDFRQAFDGAAMLDRYRALLIDPYRATLRAFDPLAASDVGRRQRRRQEQRQNEPSAVAGPGRAA